MNILEEFRIRHRQYLLHKALLGIDEINFFAAELDHTVLSEEERRFLDESRSAYDEEERETWRSLEEAGHALEAAQELNVQLQEAKGALENQRDELQSAYDQLDSQKQKLEQRNGELVDIKERLEVAKEQVDVQYDRAVEKLRLREDMNLRGERLRGQHNLLSRQNWMGCSVVVGTGLLFWGSGHEIIAGAFVTLSSMFLQTLAGNFAGFFGGGHLGQQQQQQHTSRLSEPIEPAPRTASRKH